MARLQRVEEDDKITYTVISGAAATTFVIHKKDNCHVEILMEYPIAGAQTWQDYIALFEDTNTFV